MDLHTAIIIDMQDINHHQDIVIIECSLIDICDPLIYPLFCQNDLLIKCSILKWNLFSIGKQFTG